jgi:solute carrier family 13 (sodium-dependent dicarboxylate transporter), member 2/3/5
VALLLRRFTPIQLAGLVGGVAAFAAIALVDSPLQRFGAFENRPALAAAVAALMAAWWLTEALPIYVTACVPLVAFPLLDPFGKAPAARLGATVLPYVNEYVFLFAGGMCIGAAMQQWGLDRRIALGIMRRVGADPRRLLLGFLVATAFISMWISNTATAAMMVPIGLAVVRQIEQRAGGARLAGYGAAVMMSVAYAANLGGIGTKIGTAPNGQLCGVLHDMGVDVSFLQFAAIGLPFVALMLPAAWWLLWRVGRVDAPVGLAVDDTLAAEIAKLGRPARGERIVLAVFVGAASLWIFGKYAADAVGSRLSTGQIEGGVAVAAALVLLASAAGGRRVLGPAALKAVPWETLLLLGGSFAMASGIEKSGLSQWLAARLEVLRELPAFGQVLATSAGTVAISAVASNTASVSVLLPLLRDAVAPAHVVTVLFASTIAASCDFALPAGTPPNAIVFGSGYVSIPTMAKTGVVLDVVAAVVVAAWTSLVVPLVLRGP